jgi:2-iminoacetate synthase ThiH
MLVQEMIERLGAATQRWRVLESRRILTHYLRKVRDKTKLNTEATMTLAHEREKQKLFQEADKLRAEHREHSK